MLYVLVFGSFLGKVLYQDFYFKQGNFAPEVQSRLGSLFDPLDVDYTWTAMLCEDRKTP